MNNTKLESSGSELLVEWPSTRSASRRPQTTPTEDPRENGLENFPLETDSPSSSIGRIASSDDSTTSTSVASSLSHKAQHHQPHRAIHFSPSVHIKTIPSLKDYSSERIGSMYYSKADLAEQTIAYVATAKAMHRRSRRGEDPLQVHEVKVKNRQESDRQASVVKRPTATTTRGLEHMASPRTLEFHLREQRDIIGAVLLAQENHCKPEDMAALYAHQTRSAKTRARCLGLADADL